MNAKKSNECPHDITVCPNCGSKEVRCVRRALTRSHKGRRYTIPNLRFHECASCGELVFDANAVQQIQDRSPAFAKSHRLRKSA